MKQIKLVTLCLTMLMLVSISYADYTETVMKKVFFQNKQSTNTTNQFCWVFYLDGEEFFIDEIDYENKLNVNQYVRLNGGVLSFNI